MEKNEADWAKKLENEGKLGEEPEEIIGSKFLFDFEYGSHPTHVFGIITGIQRINGPMYHDTAPLLYTSIPKIYGMTLRYLTYKGDKWVAILNRDPDEEQFCGSLTLFK